MAEKAPLILLIEDEPATARLVQHKVSGEGYRFEHRSNGKEGYDAAVSLKPDVIILDVMLPSMNGFEILRKIRQHSVIKDTKVIMLTSKNREEDIKTGFDLEVDEYMDKPFRPGELIMRLSKVLS
ncbi:response regulator transcription factor [Balneola sp. MJW-20]|uniref:response regulator transcription factor n=1 Tax=Gracilimonas aurantiaca TaxID=3234185 RepID=UPI003466C59C